MTNTVDAATNVVSQIGNQVASSFSQQASQGREVLEQALAWLAQHGISCLINV